MNTVVLPLFKRAREFGYIIWKKENDGDIRLLLGQVKKIEVIINGTLIGIKNIDWKYRRIAITYTLTRSLPKDTSKINLTTDSKGRLLVRFS